MDSILTYKLDKNEDFYTILGCDELSDTEQINSEYRAKVLLCHPDKNPENPDAAEKFSLLQKAKDVLSDPQQRKQYDHWRRSGIAMSYKNWIANKHANHSSMHWAAREKKDKMLEEGASNNQEKKESEWGNIWHRDDNEALRKFRNYDI